MRGAMAHRLPAALRDVALSDECGGGLVPGWTFPGRSLRGPRRSPEAAEGFRHEGTWWQWRFGPDPMRLGLPPGAPAPEHAIEGGRYMLDEPYVEFEEDKWRARG
ncbi:hypothetical protein VTK56DRAFT_6206 [Thermocarpiscus australiensis]